MSVVNGVRLRSSGCLKSREAEKTRCESPRLLLNVFHGTMTTFGREDAAWLVDKGSTSL